MLENLVGTSSQEALSRIESLRAPEPIAPTEAVNGDTPEDNAEPQAEQQAHVEAPEPEELEAASEPSNDLEEIYDFNGREISLKQIKEWEDGHLMQSDYTRKTQALAEEKKTFESQRESLTTKQAKLDEQIAAMEVHLSEFDNETFDGMTREELRDIDPGQYLKITEQQKSKEDALKKAKSESSLLTKSKQVERNQQMQSELISNHPEWVENGQLTSKYQEDTKRAMDYMVSKGFTQEDQESIGSSRVWEALLDASKSGDVQAKAAAIKKKVKRAPVVTKPGAGTKTVSQNEVQKAQANHKKYGTQETAIALRKARRNAANN